MPTAPDTHLPVPLDPAHPLFVLGHNGVGKSALMHALHMQLRNAAQGSPIIFVPGSRPGYFEHESLSLTPESKRVLDVNAAVWDQSPDVRWRPMQGTIRNEKAIFNLQAADVQFRIDASNDIAVRGTQSGAIAKLMARNGPLDRANRLLKQANLPVQLVFSNGEVKATRGGAPYSIARLSDGERASLLLIAETLSAASGSFFVIDEPELHIHRSIVVPLLAALIKERPDCAYLISTHEINLPQEIETSRVLMVRGCEWVGAQVQAWDADLLPPSSEIPDELERDILGSRRKILFIEGIESSLDEPLYALLFPKVSIRPKESCRDVQRAVVGLRSVPNLHSTEPYGLIDNDSLAQEEIEKLQAQQIYALPIFSVESLYSSPSRASTTVRKSGRRWQPAKPATSACKPQTSWTRPRRQRSRR